MATARRTRPANDASRTITLNPAQPREGDGPEAGPSNEQPPAGVLRLRGAPTNRQRVKWDEDTVDNEHLGKKKSKICCIYHKPRPFDESSSSESDSSDEDDEGPRDDANGAPDEHEHGPGCHHGRGKKRRHRHNHSHDDEPENRAGPNAYEVQPEPSKGKERER